MGWAKTAALIDRLRANVDADGARLPLIGIADLVTLDPSVGGETYDLEQVNRMLVDRAGTYGIPVLDLLPGFQAYYDQTGKIPFWPGDGHWNAAGHKLCQPG